MPQLLLEILSEEIPARMQAKAEADLVKALMDGLTAAGLIPDGIKGFSGPRRLVAVVEGLPVKSADVVEDVIGPEGGRAGARPSTASSRRPGCRTSRRRMSTRCPRRAGSTSPTSASRASRRRT